MSYYERFYGGWLELIIDRDDNLYIAIACSYVVLQAFQIHFKLYFMYSYSYYLVHNLVALVRFTIGNDDGNKCLYDCINSETYFN